MPNWYAIYTRSRYEKKVFSELIARGIDAYLPLNRTLRRWSDRKVWVEEPYIRSYVFVNVDANKYALALQVTGAVKYIFFEGKPAIIPDWQIELLKKALEIGKDYEITNKAFAPGDKVMISRGAFINFSGELLETQGKHKVIIRIDHIGHSILLTIPLSYLEKV